MPLIFWPYAIITITTMYFMNCMPSKTLNGLSPFELGYHKYPTYDILRTFGA